MELRASIEDKKRIQDLKKSVNRFGNILRFFMHGEMGLLVEKMYQARKCSFCFVHVLHETTLPDLQGCFMKNKFVLKNT